MTSRRWVTIGEVRVQFITVRNWGVQGFSMRWRGRVAWCQPCEFLDWPLLLWAVRNRLRLAGLDTLAIASRIPDRSPMRGFQWDLICLVQRANRGDANLHHFESN